MEDTTVRDAEDILRESDAFAKAIERSANTATISSWDTVIQCRGGHAQTRGVGWRISDDVSSLDGARRVLMLYCSDENIKRFRDAERLEALFPQDLDHAPLILAVCQIVESELRHLVAEPSRMLHSALVTSETRLTVSQRNVVTRWLDGTLPTTLGTVEILLCALRRLAQAGFSDVVEFFTDRFEPTYMTFLINNGFGRAVARIRNSYRNPVAHAERQFQLCDYRELCRLSVGNSHLSRWLAYGPEDQPLASDLGVLHHHWSLRRATGKNPINMSSESVEPLMDADTSPTLPIQKESPHSVALMEGDDLQKECSLFRIGDTICLRIESRCQGHIWILEEASDGMRYLLFPNAAQRHNWIDTTQVLAIPPLKPPTYDLPVLGPPGQERLIVLLDESKPSKLSDALDAFVQTAPCQIPSAIKPPLHAPGISVVIRSFEIIA